MRSSSRRSKEADYLQLHLRSVPAFRALLRAVECRLFAGLDLAAPILDLGCGDGHFASLLFPVPLAVGLDPSPEAVAEAAGRCSHKGLMIASGTAIPCADECFATVLSNCVLEHVPDVDRALGEVWRVLTPGGTFVFTVPSEHFGEFLLGSTLLRRLGVRQLARAYQRWFNGLSRHHHLYGPQVWQEKLARKGFEVVKWRYYFSEAAMHAFDLAHYYSLPSLLTKKLLGRWVLWPRGLHLVLLERWLRRYYEEDAPNAGGYLFFVCRKESR